MEEEGSITRWIGALRGGDQGAAQVLFEAYFHRLTLLARARLRGTRLIADEEDVALSAFDSFCRRSTHGEFPRLTDRNNLWRVLYVLTVRKAINQANREGRQRRGGHRVVSLEDLAHLDAEQVLALEATPALAAQMTEECHRLLALLDDESLRKIAVWKMEGHTNREIADRLGCVEPTVERKLQRIRHLWQRERADPPDVTE